MIQYCNYDIKGTLAVTGTTTLSNQLTFPYGFMSDYIYHTGDGNTYFGFPSNDTFRVVTDSTARFEITTSTVNVSNAPFKALGALATGSGMAETGVGLGQASNYAHAQFSGSAGGYIDFAEPNVDWSGRIIYTHSSDSMVFYTATSAVLTLDNVNNATFAGDVTVSGGDITLGGTGRIQGVDTVSSGTDAANKTYVDNAVSGVSSGVTSVATTNGITGGTITSTGTIQLDSTVVRTTGNQTVGGIKTFSTYMKMEEDHYINYRFEMIENANPQYILLCRNAASNDVNGVIRMDRTSGNYQAASVEVIVSSGSGAMYGGTLRTLQVLQQTEDYKLISCTYNGDSWIAVKYYGNAYPETTGAYFTGRIKSTSTFLTVVSSGVTNEASFGGTTESYNEVDSFVVSGDATISGGDITLGGTGRIQGIDTVSASTDAANKAYVDASVPTVNNATITIAAGTNLTTGGNFTTNQSSNETITINMATGGVGAGTYGSTSDSTKIDNITVDAYGRVTAVTTGATGKINTVSTGNQNTIVVGGTTIDKTITANTSAVSSSSSNLATGAQIQTAINSAVTGVLKYQGTWNANTNSPSLSSGSGTPGYYYIVSVAGSTNLDGITDWAVGDWAVFSDQATDAWQKIDNTQVGNVTGSGASGKVAYWNSSSNLTSQSNFTFDGNNLAVGGTMTWSGGGSGESNLAYDRSITSFGDTGTSTITLTIGQQNGNSLSTSFNVPQGTITSIGTPSDGGLTGGTITSTGNLRLKNYSALSANRVMQWDNTNNQLINAPITISGNNATLTGDLTVSGGDITLSGTGRIQGVDTVSAGTDAANKTYVDNAIAGVPQGDITGVTAGDGMTGGGSSGSVTLNVVGGDGITANANDIEITPAQTTITSIYNTSLLVGGASGVNSISFEGEKIAFTASSTQIGNMYGGGFRPATNNTQALGTSTSKWSSVYATTFLGDLNGTINTATTGVTQSQGNNSTKIATTAYVDSYNSGVQTINEGLGIKKSGTASDVTISANYDSGDTDNLIFGANAITAAVGSKPYTPYILAAESNPGVSFGEVKNLRLQSIPLDRFADATSTIDMGGNKILDVANPTSAQDAATKAYVDANAGTGNVTGSGLSTRIAFWDGGSSISSDQDLTFAVATNRLSSGNYIIPNNGDYLGTDTSGAARTLITLDNSNNVEISNSALSLSSDTNIYFGDTFRVKDGGNTRLSIQSNGTMSNSGNTFNSGPINLEEDNKITFDDDGDQWNWIQATSGEMEMAVGSTLTLTNVEESLYADIKMNSLYRIVSSGVSTNATYIPIYTDTPSSTVPRFQRTQTPSKFLENAGAVIGAPQTSGRVAVWTGSGTTNTLGSDTLYWNSSTNVLGINYSGSTFNSGALQIQGPTTNSGQIGLQIYNSTTGSPYGSHGIFVNGPRYGNAGISVKNPNLGSTFMRFYNNSGSSIGTITQSGSSSTSYNTSSDYRLKENIEPMTGSIERLKALKPSRFNFINEAADERGVKNKVDGFIAHEAAGVVPEAVTGQKDALNYEGEPEYQSIDQSKLVPLLTSALQEALVKIESLESRLDALEQK